MKLFTLEYWPVHVICVGMIAAAVIDWWKFKVPNKLTFPLILSGWVLGLCNNFGLEAGEGGIGAALAGTFLGMGLLLPVYAIGGMGAGDVKMTMGFGSWIGAFFGMGQGMWIIVYAFCAGTIVGGIIAQGIGDVADKANRRRSRWHRLPYGVPLCIGFLGYLLYLGL